MQSQNQCQRSFYNQAFPHLLPNEYWSLLPQDRSSLYSTEWSFHDHFHFHTSILVFLLAWREPSILEFIRSLWLFCLLLSTVGILEKKGYSLILLYAEKNWLVGVIQAASDHEDNDCYSQLLFINHVISALSLQVVVGVTPYFFLFGRGSWFRAPSTLMESSCSLVDYWLRFLLSSVVAFSTLLCAILS